ncbi:MAG TPA: hypothetical protein VGK74_20105 [Symbiobacteriaceae bacterium]
MRKGTALLQGLLLSALLVLALLPTARAATPGGVFVTGHDPDYHAQRGSNAAGAQRIIQKAIGYVTYNKVNPHVLLVEDLTNPGGDQSRATFGMTAAGYTYDLADYGSGAAGTLDLHTVNFSLYDVVVVASDYGSWLAQRELDVLNSRSADLINYVNAGGGIVAFSEAGNRGNGTGTTHDRFKFLPFLVSEVALSQWEVGQTVTPAGAALGLTNADINDNASHSYFSATGGMDVIDVDPQGHYISLATRGSLISPVGNCTPTPSVTWNPPLSAETPYHQSVEQPLHVQFRYGTCVAFLHDESVIVQVVDLANPNGYPISASVYGWDVAIDDATQTYQSTFDPALYSLTPGTNVQIQVFIGGELVGAAEVDLIP